MAGFVLFGRVLFLLPLLPGYRGHSSAQSLIFSPWLHRSHPVATKDLSEVGQPLLTFPSPFLLICSPFEFVCLLVCLCFIYLVAPSLAVLGWALLSLFCFLCAF